MKKYFGLRIILTLLVLVFIGRVTFASQKKDSEEWRAGVASVVITPEKPMWMAGYASRNHAADGAIHDLWAKALILEDMKGKRALLITTDLESFPKYLNQKHINKN